MGFVHVENKVCFNVVSITEEERLIGQFSVQTHTETCNTTFTCI